MLNWFKKTQAPAAPPESELQQLLAQANELAAEHDLLQAKRKALRARIDQLIDAGVSATVAGQELVVDARTGD